MMLWLCKLMWLLPLLTPAIVVILINLFSKKKKPMLVNQPSQPAKPKERFRFYTDNNKETKALAKTLKEKFQPLFDKIVEFDSISVEFTFTRKSEGKKMLLDVAFVAKIKDETKAKFSLRSMPGCGSIVISHNTWVDESLRGKGLGSVMNMLKKDIVEAWGSNKIIATVVANNDKEKGILARQGWKLVDVFQNSQTDNPVEVWSKTLDVKNKSIPNPPVSNEGTKDAPNSGEAVTPNDANPTGESK